MGMEAHAIVSERPVIARLGVSLGHHYQRQRLQSSRQSSSTIEPSVFNPPVERLSGSTYALPPPMMKTRVSKSRPNCLAGPESRLSSSAWRSKLSNRVLRIQNFHSIVSLPPCSVLIGKKRTFPRQVAPGDSVRNTIGQSMNCYGNNIVSVCSVAQPCDIHLQGRG